METAPKKVGARPKRGMVTEASWMSPACLPACLREGAPAFLSLAFTDPAFSSGRCSFPGPGEQGLFANACQVTAFPWDCFQSWKGLWIGPVSPNCFSTYVLDNRAMDERPNTTRASSSEEDDSRKGEGPPRRPQRDSLWKHFNKSACSFWPKKCMCNGSLP